MNKQVKVIKKRLNNEHGVITTTNGRQWTEVFTSETIDECWEIALAFRNVGYLVVFE